MPSVGKRGKFFKCDASSDVVVQFHDAPRIGKGARFQIKCQSSLAKLIRGLAAAAKTLRRMGLAASRRNSPRVKIEEDESSISIYMRVLVDERSGSGKCQPSNFNMLQLNLKNELRQSSFGIFLR
ncbi:hypothetical protein T07_2661 [Trichinella nelsoni]|uniref:Uncharacterized protein n=1 Tax=Trichinella nelsoni TaxID=6336 RepID=A0A0V0RLE7_9BILA|nr:hypothetical protein T07_2661 [Trichinella nelsoni]